MKPEIIIDTGVLPQLVQRFQVTEEEIFRALELPSFRDRINEEMEITAYVSIYSADGSPEQIRVIKGGPGLVSSAAKARAYSTAMQKALEAGTAQFITGSV